MSDKKPTSPPFEIKSLLGDKLLTKVGQPSKSTSTLFKDKELVALYFSASWCPPCKAFSPVLSNFYTACQQSRDIRLEIVYISSDKTVPEFEEYYKKMPWLAIPSETGSAAIKNNLAQTMGITGIPTLIVLDVKTGEFVTARAREDVQIAAGGSTKNGGAVDMDKLKQVILEWKNMERKPLEEAKNAVAGGPQNPIVQFFMFFARNPMFIFALLYFYKWIVRTYKDHIGNGDDADVDAGDVVDAGAGDAGQGMESEF